MFSFHPGKESINRNIAKQCLNMISGLEIFDHDGNEQKGPEFKPFAPIEDNNGNINTFKVQTGGVIIYPGATQQDCNELGTEFDKLIRNVHNPRLDMCLDNYQFGVVVSNDELFSDSYNYQSMFVIWDSPISNEPKKNANKKTAYKWFVANAPLQTWLDCSRSGIPHIKNNTKNIGCFRSNLKFYNYIFVDLDDVMEPGRTLTPFKPENLKCSKSFIGKCTIGNMDGFYVDMWTRFNKKTPERLNYIDNVKLADLSDANRLRTRHPEFNTIEEYVNDEYDFDGINDLLMIFSELSIEKKHDETCFTCKMPLFDNIYILSWDVEILCCPVCVHSSKLPKKVKVFKAKHPTTLDEVLKANSRRFPAHIRNIYKGIQKGNVKTNYNIKTASINHTVTYDGKEYCELFEEYELYTKSKKDGVYYFVI